MRNWLHWHGNGWNVMFHTQGNCWRFGFRRDEYATCVFYTLWRFELSIDKGRANA